ncbi:hypothetical protein G6514_007655 [Epicoccum nigrum]|nr:hypothetical protein G6514_007655 [Epicoccum nigrum]
MAPKLTQLKLPFKRESQAEINADNQYKRVRVDSEPAALAVATRATTASTSDISIGTENTLITSPETTSSVATPPNPAQIFQPFAQAAKSQLPRIILLARSSSEPPDVWFAHKGDWKEGLWFWGRKILEHFVAYSGITGAAILHAASDTQTRYLPAPNINNSSALSGQARWESYRAFKFTQAWTDDIKAANAAGIVPTVLSIGLDAWACDVRMLHPWLQTRTISFHLHMRLNGLQYGMTTTHITFHREVYWAQYDVATMLAALNNDMRDAAVDELIAAWSDLQT